jgi:hypothetical protein
LQFYLFKTVGRSFYHAAELITQLAAIHLMCARRDHHRLERLITIPGMRTLRRLTPTIALWPRPAPSELYVRRSQPCRGTSLSWWA